RRETRRRERLPCCSLRISGLRSSPPLTDNRRIHYAAREQGWDMFSRKELEDARAQVHAVFPGTPQYRWPLLAARVGTELWVKHENHTPTGAFKVRGGLILLERLARERLAPNGIISATRGNHGQSLDRK